jgi:RNA-binding protein
MSLSEPQKKYLRGLGHDLKPIVMVGDAGVSGSVLAELDTCLDHHELVKVRVKVGDRAARDEAISQLVTRTSATLVQQIGNMALLFRASPEKNRIRLPR